MKKTSAYARNRQHAAKLRINAAIKEKAKSDFQSQLATIRLKIYTTQDGDDATEMLSQLMGLIGTLGQAGSLQYGRSEPWVRQLHGALRTINEMCRSGYRWQAQFANAMDRALEVAEQNSDGIELQHFQAAWLDACAVASQVLSHSLPADAIE